jgi:hypothetical protein
MSQEKTTIIWPAIIKKCIFCVQCIDHSKTFFKCVYYINKRRFGDKQVNILLTWGLEKVRS